MKRLYLLMLLVSACVSNAAETMKVLKLAIAPENVVGKVAYPAKNGGVDWDQARENNWSFSKGNKFYEHEIVLLPRSDKRITYALVAEDLGDGEYLLSFDSVKAEKQVKKDSAEIGKFVLKAESAGSVPQPPAEEKKAAAAQKYKKKS